jgi:hypothetical protein
MNDKIQKDIFGNEIKDEEGINKIEDHWIDMPEFIAKERQKPYKVALIKFRNEEDFKKFSKLLREHIFNGDLSWGTIKRKVRTAWYPPFEKSNDYRYIDDEE